MIYNTNLDFRMQHILAPFNVSGNTSKAECLNIANFLQVAFYMKYCSQMIEKIEPPEMLCKSRVTLTTNITKILLKLYFLN